MGEPALIVLAFGLSAAFGVGGVLSGVWIGVRSVTRDEERYGQVVEALERVASDQQKLRLDWGRTIESLEELSETIERRRRRIAASESSLNKKEALQAGQDPPRPLTPAEERDQIRRRMKRVV